MRRLMMSLVLLATLLLLVDFSLAASASIKDQYGNVVSLYFTGSASNPNYWYKDAQLAEGNPDVTLEVCGVGQKYVGATYAINVSNEWKYVLITYYSSSQSLAYTNAPGFDSGCYYVSPMGNLVFSPSQLTLTPPVYYAAFPGRIWVMYSSSPSGTNPGFIFVPESNGYLKGYYTFHRSFNEDTKKITVGTPTVTYYPAVGSFSKPADDSTFGINNDRRMVIGACKDDYGSHCYDGMILTTPSFPLELYSGVDNPTDQQTFDRYIVINGLGSKICIGANLKATTVSVSPNPVYFNQTLTITFSVKNDRDEPYELKGGNVKVTTNFEIKIRIYNSSNPSQVVYETTQAVTDDLLPEESITLNTSWLAQAHSGTYTVEVTVDSDNDIAECDETDNSVTTQFELKPVYIPVIRINGAKSTVFPVAGMPYNFSLFLKNSDDEIVSNATIQVVEENGISIFAPTQTWTATIGQQSVKTGVKSYSIAEFMTNDEGVANVTLIPTGNKLYTSEYSYTNIKSYVGNYSIYLQGHVNGEKLIFNVKGELTYKYPLEVASFYYTEPTEVSSYLHIDEYVKQIMDWVYSIYSIFWKSVVGG